MFICIRGYPHGCLSFSFGVDSFRIICVNENYEIPSSVEVSGRSCIGMLNCSTSEAIFRWMVVRYNSACQVPLLFHGCWNGGTAVLQSMVMTRSDESKAFERLALDSRYKKSGQGACVAKHFPSWANIKTSIVLFVFSNVDQTKHHILALWYSLRYNRWKDPIKPSKAAV